MVALPGLEYREKHGLDVTDWFEMGNTIERFNELVDQTPDYAPAPENGRLYVVTHTQLLDMKLPPREMLLAPFLPSQGLVLLSAQRGVGKTHVGLGIAYAVASGGTFLKWHAPMPQPVLYVDGEMPAVTMQERLAMIKAMSNKHPELNYLQVLTPDLQPKDKSMPDLSTQEGREEVELLAKNVVLVVIDNISCMFRKGGENDSDSWQDAQSWALGLRRQGKSILFVHHAGKSGQQRGTSKREDILDTAIMLEHPDDYKREEGARFNVIFTKSRHFFGEDARPFQAHLKKDGDKTQWQLSAASQEEETEQVALLKNQGYTIKRIEEATGLTKSMIETRTKKAEDAGLID
ncbi:MAG: AAA family ATPase [Candidatus Babeliaceae bacterium]|nr:AAA family ATPase [Candidatus Babeliaceae bacterium]